jgi:hypothetical protein
MSYADEKSYLITEIERLKYSLASESTSAEYEKVKGELLRGRVEILHQANDELYTSTNERFNEGAQIRGEMEDKVIYQKNKMLSVGAQVSKLNHTEIPRREKDRSDIESDISRLNTLSERYAALDRDLIKCTEEFEKS